MVQYNVNLEGKTVLVTGVAGFIGSNLALSLLKEVKDIKVVGIDNMNASFKSLMDLRWFMAISLTRR